jgi:hypothetical protein
MSVALSDILMLAGPLDDTPGFDTPRERFRRFLIEHMGDARIARAFIEECQHGLGEQHHRALQDMVVALGRCLGFETIFGTYHPVPGALQYDGHWRARGRLHIVLDLRTDQRPGTDMEGLSRSLWALSAVPYAARGERTFGLCVATPLYPNAPMLERALAAEKTDPPIRFVRLRSLLAFTDLATAGRLTHDDIVRLFASTSALDFVVELLDRFVEQQHSQKLESRS